MLDLTSSNPTACGFALSPSNLLEPLQNVKSVLYTPDPKGLQSARESIARYYAGYGATISAEQIVLTASTSESYSHLLRLLCEPGDEILIAQPSYPLFSYLADLSDVKLGYYPLFYDHGWWIDTAELERAISPRTRAIVVVHPNNPTGHPTSSSEREYLCELCRQHHLTLIVDEVFLDYAHRGFPRLESFASSNTPPLMFVLSGLSKMAALPQVKVGWMLVLGPALERLEALARLELIADTFLSVNTPSQLALPQWLTRAPETQREILDRISINRSQLAAAKIEMHDLSAGWSAIIRLPQIFRHETTFQMLNHLAVLTHPTYFYGLQDSKRVVVSLITPAETLKKAVERIAEQHG